MGSIRRSFLIIGAALCLPGTVSISIAFPQTQPVDVQVNEAGATDSPDSNTEMQVSPFLAGLELRSLISLPGTMTFSLHNAENGRAFWIGLGEIYHGIEAVSFNPNNNTLTVRDAEHARTLSLASARIRHEKITFQGHVSIMMDQEEIEIENVVFIVGEESRLPLGDALFLRVAVTQDPPTHSEYPAHHKFEVHFEEERGEEIVLLTRPFGISTRPGQKFTVTNGSYAFSLAPQNHTR